MKKPWKTVIWCCVAAALLWWFFPRRVAPFGGETASIHFESGLTGHGCDLRTPEEVQTLLDTLEHTWYVRTVPRLFASGGYSYILRLNDAAGNEIQHVTVHSGGLAFVGASHACLIGAGGFGKLNDILRAYTDPAPET